jgi:hypothetical protein
MDEYTKNCPSCGEIQTYGYKHSLIHAIKNNKICKSCKSKERANRPDWRNASSERQRGKRTGNDNHFYGKKHSDETKELIRKKRAEQYIPSGKDNPLFGKTLEEIVGYDKAKEMKSKKSKMNKGSGNPMFGKPSPTGSGNGWSGWYNGWFFRSILELSYMIKVIERYNMNWKNGEDKKHAITYTDVNGIVRTYYPDFIINNKYIVEIKPTKLMKTLKVMEKVNAGIEYCNKNNMIYKITNIPSLTTDEFRELVNTNKVKLTNRYNEKYINEYTNQNN